MPNVLIARASSARSNDPGYDQWRGEVHLSTEPTPLHYRARAYRALAELLRAGPTNHALDEARVILGADLALNVAAAPLTALRHLIAETASLQPEQWRSAFMRIPRRCANPRHEARLWACAASRVAPDDSRTTDLLVLATMAEDIDLAHRRGHESPIAGAMNERRIAFLADHAAACLRPLARELLESPAHLLTGMGRALRMLLATEPNGTLAA